MTTAAICATREVSWSPSFCGGEQYDPDLGLYYLRARYYNPLTGTFLSHDPEGPPHASQVPPLRLFSKPHIPKRKNCRRICR